jgi:hypothetical protein
MRTEVGSCIDPNTPLATRLFFRSCLESSPVCVNTKLSSRSAERNRGDGAHVQLHELKRTLLQGVLEETCDAGLLKRLCGAANQAAELAWATSHPLLVFPCLFDELVQRVQIECESLSGQVSASNGACPRMKRAVELFGPVSQD